VSLLVVPLTLIGLVLPVDLVLHLAHALMAACGWLLERLSALPAAVWQQHAPPAWTVVVALAGVVWLLLPRGFPARWVGVAAALPLFLVAPPPLPHGELSLAMLDVGQGLAIVARTRSHALLYDAGPALGPQADSGNRVIVPYLRASGVRALNAMVVSHGDTDHSGGAASVLQAMPVGRFVSSLEESHPLLAQAARSQRCQAGERWVWDEVEFEILHPAAENYAREKFKANDRGCVLRISTAGASVLLAADIEQKSERELLSAASAKLRAQVLQVPHHGSRTSSSPEFVDRVNPDVAIVSAGYRNRFGHPKDDVIDRYRALGSRVYRTDRDGALLLVIGAEGNVAVQRYRSLYRRYWHALPANADMADEGIE
jgi:competence protein ComEC